MKKDRATYYRGKKPWATKAKRVCSGKNCTALLSRYNKLTICATCERAIPLNERPYRHKF